MDLLSTIRKSGSRGGVNFSWDDVSTSAHRENYLGHSLKAPVGRWQKGRDLNWYAKADDSGPSDETAEEKKQRERKEEIRRVKEAEEDALNRALGLPVVDRSNSGGVSSGANNIGLGEMKRLVGEAGVEESEGKGFGDFVGKVGAEDVRDIIRTGNMDEGGLVGGEKRKNDDQRDRGRRRDERDEERRSRRREKGERRPRDERRRSRSPGRDHKRGQHRARSRSRSPYRRRRERSQSPGNDRKRNDREYSRERRRARRRSRSRDGNEIRRHQERSPDRHGSRRDREVTRTSTHRSDRD